VTSPAHLAQAAVEPERRIAFDVERVRADFPILGRTVYDRPLVYLDNAASAQKPRAMIDTMRQILEGEYANVHRGLHYLSQTLTDKYEGAREKVARFINAGSWEEIVFTRNATEAINLVAASYGRTFLDHGDEVVISHMEHHANIVPWQLLRTDKGIRLRVVPIDDDGNFLLKEYEKLLGPRTKLVAVTHASNHAHQGDRAPGPRQGYPGPGRRLPGGGACPRRRARARCGLLCVYRPQAVWAHRHRGSLRQDGAAREDAALSGRRRDDQPGHL
jgi:hypothetical protein